MSFLFTKSNIDVVCQRLADSIDPQYSEELVQLIVQFFQNHQHNKDYAVSDSTKTAATSYTQDLHGH